MILQCIHYVKDKTDNNNRFHSMSMNVISSHLHQVTFVPDLAALDPPFPVVGPALESHPAFPQKVNAEFVQVR